MADTDQRIRDLQREYLDFLDDEVSFFYYQNSLYNNLEIFLLFFPKGRSRDIRNTCKTNDQRKLQTANCKHQ
jgi:hypothetical protein